MRKKSIDGKVLSKLIRKETYGKLDTEYKRKLYEDKKYAQDRLPETIRSANKLHAIQCLNVSAKDKGFCKELYLNYLQLSACKIFAFMIQDITDENFIFEDEYDYVNQLKTESENNKLLGVFRFRNRNGLTREEFLEIANYPLFTIEDFENFKQNNKYINNITITEEEFDKLLEYYSIQINRIKSSSKSIEKPKFGSTAQIYEIDDYTSYNKLMENIDYIKENFLEKTTEQTV